MLLGGLEDLSLHFSMTELSQILHWGGTWGEKKKSKFGFDKSAVGDFGVLDTFW